MTWRRVRLGTGPGEARITLLVSGFGQQSTVTPDEIVEALSRPPARHLAGLTEVRYDPARLYPLSRIYEGRTMGRSRCLGEFVTEERKIYIYDFDSRRRCLDILYHELGHYVFHTALDSVRRKEWVTGLYPRSRYVSDYAGRNAMEDFSESYAVYLMEPDRLRAIPAKYRFMRRWVFGTEGSSRARSGPGYLA